MKTSVEISYYPLNQEYVPPIRDFIDRIKAFFCYEDHQCRPE